MAELAPTKSASIAQSHAAGRDLTTGGAGSGPGLPDIWDCNFVRTDRLAVFMVVEWLVLGSGWLGLKSDVERMIG